YGRLGDIVDLRSARKTFGLRQVTENFQALNLHTTGRKVSAWVWASQIGASRASETLAAQARTPALHRCRGMELLFDALQEFLGGERFLEKIFGFGGGEIDVAAREKDGNAWVKPANVLGHFFAADSRHDPISDYQVYFAGGLLEKIHRRFGTAGGEHLVAIRTQHGLAEA